MKKVTLGLLLFTSILACSKEKEGQSGPQVKSSWIMTAHLQDPGDGSGTFVPVNSTKYLKFYANGTLRSNGDICSMDSSATNATTGTYSVADSSLTSAGCSVTIGGWPIRYEMNGDTLDVHYPCIEPCIARYIAMP
jgi:hypothetical protein